MIDKASANDDGIAKSLREARLIYMLGGFTGYLGETLKGSAAWEAVLQAYHAGAVVAGSSAGAMVMCEFYHDPNRGKVIDGLNLVKNSIVLPHHNTFGHSWASRLLEILPVTLIGIDEQTGMIDDGVNDGARTWTVHGAGNVTLYQNRQVEVYTPGKSFSV